MPWAGRSNRSTSEQRLWIEIAASWPWATAQMMFFGPHAASPPKKTPGSVDCIVDLVDDRHIPLAELHAEVALDPGEGVLLTDGEDHVVTGDDHRTQHRGLLRAVVPLEDVELHPDELAVLDDEALGRVVHDDLDALFFGVVELPRRGLEVLARSSRHDLDVGAPESPRRTTAVHGGVADADDQDTRADRVDVTEGDRLEPVDADEDVRVDLVVATGDVQLLAARRADADEDRVEALVEQRAQAGDRRVVADLDAHVEDHLASLLRALGREDGTTGMFVRIRPPGLSNCSNITTS